MQRSEILSMSSVVQRHCPGHVGDFMLGDVNAGAFEVYDLAGN